MERNGNIFGWKYIDDLETNIRSCGSLPELSQNNGLGWFFSFYINVDLLRHTSNYETGSLSEHHFQVEPENISKPKPVKRKSQIFSDCENELPMCSRLHKNEVRRKKYQVKKDQINKGRHEKYAENKKASSF